MGRKTYSREKRIKELEEVEDGEDSDEIRKKKRELKEIGIPARRTSSTTKEKNDKADGESEDTEDDTENDEGDEPSNGKGGSSKNLITKASLEEEAEQIDLKFEFPLPIATIKSRTGKIKVNRIADLNDLEHLVETYPEEVLNLEKFVVDILDGVYKITETYEELYDKDTLIILLDTSGSMNWFAGPLAIKIVKYLSVQLLDGKLKKLILVPFEARAYISQRIECSNLQDINKMFNNFPDFWGGNTDIQKSIEDCKKLVEDNMPAQLFIINDGADYVSPNFLPVVKTHCVQLLYYAWDVNNNLKTACLKSGGTFQIKTRYKI